MCAAVSFFILFSLSFLHFYASSIYLFHAITTVARNIFTHRQMNKWIENSNNAAFWLPCETCTSLAQMFLFFSSEFYLMWKLRESIECNKICVFHFISIHFSFCFVIHETGRDQHQEFWFECSQRNEIKTTDLHAKVKWCVKNTISAKLKEKYCNANMNWWWNYRQSVSQTKGVRIHRIHEFQFESSNGWRGEVEKKKPELNTEKKKAKPVTHLMGICN